MLARGAACVRPRLARLCAASAPNCANMCSQPDTPYNRAGLYELRTYPLLPNKAAEFLQLTKEHFHLRTAHSEGMGYWTAEMGGLNQAVHLWYYDSLCHRKAVRTALAQDPEWISLYLSKITDMIQSQDNTLLETIPQLGVSKVPSEGSGAYELHTLDLKVSPQEWRAPLDNYARALSSVSGPCLVGAWQSTVGRLNQVVMLWRYPSLDAAIDARKQAQDAQDGLWKVTSDWRCKLLQPHAVSPLQ